ncbi:MAG: hypothetical protein EBV03_01080 [Proteobacteria bacterium]|nr:hypothetical protein [Pseudomonadota bacterium]
MGYAIAHGLTIVLPPSQHGGIYYGLLTVFFSVLLLAVPYWMLKLGSRARHDANHRERELTLKDIPKDKDQLNRSL